MKRDNGPVVAVIPDDMGPNANSGWAAGFRAVCSCDWSGTFFEAEDDDHDSHDRAHADATTEADEHAAGHGRRG